MKKYVLKLFPEGTTRKKIAKKAYHYSKRSHQNHQVPALDTSISYDDWIKDCEPKLWSPKLAETKNSPLISIIVPCFNTPEKYINPLIDSVLAQTYGNWQLCLSDGSTKPEAKTRLKELARKDPRITYIDIEDNLGIVGNTNAGLERAQGEFVAFLDHDDVLAERALNEVATVLKNHSDADLIYSDEDKLSDNGKQRVIPFFKPGWSPELLLGVNYITHLMTVRKSLVDKIGGFRPGFEGAQDYDLLLRLTEQTDKIYHIPKMLYHWRLAAGSTATTVDQKGYADGAGQRALADAVKRRSIKAKVVAIPHRPTNYRLQYKLPAKQPKVSVIIPFKDKVDLLKQCVGSIIDKSTYQNYEVILVSNNSTETATHEYLDVIKQDKRCKVVFWDFPFNYSKVNNYGRGHAVGDYLILLNNDTKVLTEDWIEELISVASQPKVGAVGPLLYYPDDTIQHAGIVLGMMTMAGHVFRRHLPTDWTDFGLPSWPRNYLAVTGACLAISAKKYDEMGGLDEVFTVAGNDVALGIKLHEKGYRNVYWPFAELIHYENVSVGSYNNVPQLDYDHSLDYYRPYLEWKDPYFNGNLDLMNEQVGLRANYG